MSRGKHKAAARNRQIKGATERIATLRQELAEESDALATAQASLEQVASARADLQRDQHELLTSTAPHARRAEDDRDWLEEVARQARQRTNEIQTAWGDYLGRCQDASEGKSQKERLESLLAALQARGVLSDGPAAGRLGAEGITRLERARGQRARVVTGGLAPDWWSPLTAGLLRPSVLTRARAAGLISPTGAFEPPLTPEAKTALRTLEQEVDAVLASRPERLTSARLLHAWAPSPLLPHSLPADSAVLTALGAQGPGPDSGPDPEFDPAPPVVDGREPAWPHPTPTLPASTRERLAAGRPADLLAAWSERLTAHEVVGADLGVHASLLGSAPRHPRPGRAAVLRSLYASSAAASWVHSSEASTGPADPADPAALNGSAVSPDPAVPAVPAVPSGPEWGGSGQRADFGRAAVALAAAAPFWLPAGQTHAFASSEDLDADDRAEIALPYPQVLLAFAEPLVLEPTRQPTAAESDAYAAWSTHLSQRLGGTRTTLGGLLRHDLTRLDAGAVLEFAGCTVEAVLLLGDSLGAPAQEFAWCVALPGRTGRAVLGRFVVPARHNLTQYQALLGNLMAATAWADWHEPDTDAAAALDVPGLPPAQARRAADRHGAGVHVLNVARTVGQAVAVAPTGRTVATHVRRGHWRRQHFGERNAQVRRIRIAPLVVNAHLGDMAEKVYRLPPTASSLVSVTSAAPGDGIT